MGIDRTVLYRWIGEQSDIGLRRAQASLRITPAGDEEKRCAVCHEWKPLTAYGEDKRCYRGFCAFCMGCQRKRSAAYYEANKERQVARTRAWNATQRSKVLTHYSNGTLRCACCGESMYEFLVIDHINGGGTAHRRMLRQKGGSGGGFYKWLVKQGYPEGFQVLCHNCNHGRSVYGTCPHVRRDSKVTTEENQL